MPRGPSIHDSNGIATLEGKLRLTGALNDDFESALTATVCLRIGNYNFSKTHVESVNFNQRLPQG